MADKLPLVLTLDFGTQSLRASLTNDKGEIENIEKFKYDPPYFSDSYGYAEQDPDYYWEEAKKTIKKLTASAPEKLGRIVGAALTTFRDTSVQLDHNLKPLRRSILWLDQRLAKGKEKLPFLHWFLFNLIGMKPTIVLNRARTVAHWLKENESDTWNRTYKYVNISTYLIYRMTGNLVDSVASVIGHYPINFKARKWYKTSHLKARIFGIPDRMLAELRQPGEVLGTINDKLAEELGLPLGIKVFATGSDKACETVGLGALNSDTAAISYGTASSISVSNQKYHEPEPFLPAYPAAVPGWYNMEVQIYRGYWMLTWFSNEIAKDLNIEAYKNKTPVEELLNSKLSSVPPGSNGLIVQPYWGPGLSRPLARGAIIGFSDIHTREHLYRAIIEGIAYSLKEGLESIEKSQRKKVKSIFVSGGGSQNDDICQITADIFNLPVSRVQTYETTSLGASIAVFCATGRFSSVEEASKEMSHPSKTFYPNEIAKKEYDYLYKNVYVKMYPQLKGIYKDINKFSKREV